MNNLSVRQMNESDLEDVLELNNLCFDPPWRLETLKNELKSKFSKYIVVLKEEKVIGYAGLWLIIDEIHITNIATHPNYRGIGASNLLMDTILNICKERNIPSITLEVRSNNTVAINLYNKYGFIKEGLRKNYYGENLDAIIMWKRNII